MFNYEYNAKSNYWSTYYFKEFKNAILEFSQTHDFDDQNSSQKNFPKNFTDFYFELCLFFDKLRESGVKISLFAYDLKVVVDDCATDKYSDINVYSLQELIDYAKSKDSSIKTTHLDEIAGSFILGKEFYKTYYELIVDIYYQFQGCSPKNFAWIFYNYFALKAAYIKNSDYLIAEPLTYFSNSIVNWLTKTTTSNLLLYSAPTLCIGIGRARYYENNKEINYKFFEYQNHKNPVFALKEFAGIKDEDFIFAKDEVFKPFTYEYSKSFKNAFLCPPTSLTQEQTDLALKQGFSSNILSNPDLAITELACEQVSGRIVSLVKATFANSTKKLQVSLRKKWIEERKLIAVFVLPGSFSYQRRSRDLLLFLSNLSEDKKDYVTFIDFSNLSLSLSNRRSYDWLHKELDRVLDCGLKGFKDPRVKRVLIGEFAKTKYSLKPEVYQTLNNFEFAKDKFETIPLSDICSITRCQIVTNDQKEKVNGKEVYLEVLPTAISQYGFVDQDLIFKEGLCDLSQVKQDQILKNDDLVLVTKGQRAGDVGIVQNIKYDEKPLIAGQYFVILRLKKDTPLTVADLFYALRSDYAQLYLKQNKTSGNLDLISASDIKNLPVLVPTDLQKDLNKKNFLSLKSSHIDLKDLKRKCEELSFFRVLDSL